MPYDLHVIRAGDFVRLQAGGRVDFEGSKRVLAGMAEAMIRRGLGRAVLDVRGVEGMLTISELYALASAFPEAGFRREHRLAVVHRATRIDRADFFATCATNRGWNVASFDMFEDAITWLSTAEPLQVGNGTAPAVKAGAVAADAAGAEGAGGSPPPPPPPRADTS